jgi:hypothetical protein
MPDYLTALHLLYLPLAACDGFTALHEIKKNNTRHTVSSRVIIGLIFTKTIISSSKLQ